MFGKTLTLSSGRVIPTRWVGEQHVREDLGHIPSFADWARAIRPEPWMGRTQKIETEVDPLPGAPTPAPDPFYPLLGLTADAAGFTVLRAEEADADEPAFNGFDLVQQDGPSGSQLWIHDGDRAMSRVSSTSCCVLPKN